MADGRVILIHIIDENQAWKFFDEMSDVETFNGAEISRVIMVGADDANSVETIMNLGVFNQRRD